MRSLSIIALLPLLLATTVPGLAQEATPRSPWPDLTRPESTDATSRKIIELHMKARGGRENLKTFRGLKVVGQLIEGKLDYELEAVYRPPRSLIIKTTRRHLGDDHVRVIATTPDHAWQHTMLPKRKLPGPLGGREQQLIHLDAVIPFMFIDPDADGHVFSYQGEGKFAGKGVYILHGWLSNGQQIEALFDNQSFHIINYRHLYSIGSAPVIVDRVPLGLARVEDTWWENGYDFRIRGKSFRTVNYEFITQTPDPGPDLYKEPPTNERWLRGS